MLKNAKDAAATEALEIATYTAIERLANAVGDEETAQLAVSIRRDEERMLARVLKEIPKLTDAVVGADVRGEGTYDVGEDGRRGGRRAARRRARPGRRRSARRARRGARPARRAPRAPPGRGRPRAGPADRALRHAHGRRDHRAAARALAGRARQGGGYERKGDNRTTMPRAHRHAGGERAVGRLRRARPSTEIRTSARQRRRRDARAAARDYERGHKQRAGVLEAAERATATA